MTKRRTTDLAPTVVWCWTNRTPGTLSRARVAMGCALDVLGCDGEVVGDTVLAVSELVANAHEHAVGPYEMRLRRTAGQVICEVEDHDPRIPRIPEFPAVPLYFPEERDRGGGLEVLCALLSERGRGLQVVNELTQGAWGFRRCSRLTKVAWLAVPAAAVDGRGPLSSRLLAGEGRWDGGGWG